MRNSERGNAVIFILVAIALFAALAYTFMRSGQQGQGNLTAGQAKLAAQEIIGYSNTVAKGVEKLLQRGCSESQLSFQNPYDTSNDYPAAPTECRIFDAAGGNVTPKEANPSWFVNDLAGMYFYYTIGDPIQNIGTTCTSASCSELNINVWGISEQLCNQLNLQLGNTYASIPSGTLWGATLNDGTFDQGTSALTVKFNTPDLIGKRAVCYNDAIYGYTFNYVLMER